MENKILEGHFQKCVYDVYMQFSAEKMCICSFVYMQFEKVDIYTVIGVKSKMSWNPTEGRVYPRIRMVWEKRFSAKKGDHFRFKDNINFCKRFFRPHEEKLVFESVRLDSLRFTSEQSIMESWKPTNLFQRYKNEYNKSRKKGKNQNTLDF